MWIEDFDSEGRFVRPDYEDFILMNIYFPNGKASRERLDYKMAFYDAFLAYSNALTAEGKKLVICGDMRKEKGTKALQNLDLTSSFNCMFY